MRTARERKPTDGGPSARADGSLVPRRAGRPAAHAGTAWSVRREWIVATESIKTEEEERQNPRVRLSGGRGGRLRAQLTVPGYLLEIGGKGGGGGTERAPAGIQTQ